VEKKILPIPETMQGISTSTKSKEKEGAKKKKKKVSFLIEITPKQSQTKPK
jgi:hypothetical protein